MIGFGRRWPRTARITAGLAIVCGIASLTSVQAYVHRVEAARPELGAPVPVVVAARDLARGVTLTSDALEVRELPEEFAPPGVVPDEAQAAGRVLVAALAEGEAITRTRLASLRTGPVAALVPPGLRAFVVTTEIPPEAVYPGDQVDVLSTIGGGRPHTETVATGLEVLSVMGSTAEHTDALSGAVSDVPRLVLLVAPDVAERLAYAVAFGELSVTIAGPDAQVVPAPPSAASAGG